MEANDTQAQPAPESKIQTPRLSSPTIGKIAAALAKAQVAFTPVPKNKVATVRPKKRQDGSQPPEYKYKYADLADVLSMALPILAKNEIAFTQPLVMTSKGLRLCTKLIHSSGEWMASDGINISEQLDPQAFGGIDTYWRRYDGCGMLGIAPDSDVDGNLENASADAEKKGAVKKGAEKKDAGPIKCEDCKHEVKGGMFSGNKVDAATYVEKTLKIFGGKLCEECVQKRKASGQTKAATKPEAAKATKAVLVPDKPCVSTIESVKPRNIKVKGETKKVYDLTLKGGLKITDWHKSHFELYDEFGAGVHIKLVYDEKQDGKWTNRSVVALMEIGEVVLEDEQGKKEAVAEEGDGTYDARAHQEVVEEGGDEGSAFDDDIPFE
jgi:ribosomal protein L34E